MTSKLHEFKNEHLQSIHRPEVDWTGVKRTVTRAPQIIGKKAHPENYKHDIEYDDLYRKLLDYETNLNKLVKETKNNNKAHKSLIKRKQELAKQYIAIYQPTLGNTKLFEAEMNGENVESSLPLQTEEDRISFEEECSKRETIEKYYQIVCDMAPAITVELQLLEDKINKTVQDILCMVKKIKKNHKEREMVLLDVEKYQSSVDKLREKTELTEKQDEQLLSLEQKLEQSTAKFNNCNSTMKREFPYFFEMVGQVMHSLTNIMYWSFDVVSYQYFQMLNLMKPDYNIGSDPFKFDQVTEIVNNFNNRIYASNKEIHKLSIINFSKNYLRNLTNQGSPIYEAETEEKKKSLKNTESNPTSPLWDTVDYVVEAPVIAEAIYDYDAEEKTDLPLIKGEKITVLEKDEKLGWWKGKNENGDVGIFPSNYVAEK